MSERGRLQVDVDGNSTGFQQTLREAKQHANAFAKEVQSTAGSSWMGIGKSLAGGIAGFLSFEGVKSMVENAFGRAEEIKDISEQFDISTDAVQRWEKACQKAGLSTNVFYRALETLRAKRAEAREDDKKAAPFEEMGLSKQAKSAAVSDEDLLKQVLNSGASRVQLSELLGRKGATLRAALGQMGGDVAYSADDIGRMDKQAKGWQAVKGFWKRKVNAEITGAFSSLFDKEFWTTDLLGDWFKPSRDRRAARDKGKTDAEAREKAQTEQDARDAEDRANYADLEKQDKKDQEDKAKLREAEDRLKAAQRQNMGKGDQREALKGELANVNKNIAGYLAVEELLSPADKLKLTDLQTRRETLMGQLREKPESFAADSMAKAGLFSASALNFSVDGDTQRQQLAVLRQIANNTGRTSTDPFKW